MTQGKLQRFMTYNRPDLQRHTFLHDTGLQSRPQQWREYDRGRGMGREETAGSLGRLDQRRNRVTSMGCREFPWKA